VRDFLDHIGRLGVPGLEAFVGPAPSGVSDPLPHRARFETQNYTNDAGSRAYKLYIPSGYRGQALPLVVMLHGCTQGPDDFASGTRMNKLAEEQTFFVVYPAQS
jgi:poly(3-hydroxybutyrate) depolymerase